MNQRTHGPIERTQVRHTPRVDATVDITIVADGSGRPRQLTGIHPERAGQVVDDYARRSHVIEVLVTANGATTSVPGPRYRAHATACRRAAIVREATRNRTGGIALLTALADTPHQRDLVADLSAVLFPAGEEASA